MNKKLHLIFLSSAMSFGAFTQFELTPQNWTIPSMETSGQNLTQVSGAGYSLVDINGDGKPDLVDCKNNASTSVWLTSANVPYWKVYLNNGAEFSTVAENWTIPSMETSGQDLTQVSGAGYSLVDINGDGKPDLVDCRNNASTSVWLTSANVPYWKVYLNSGTAFSTVAENWTIPTMETSGQNLIQVSGDAYSLVDINGDDKPDLVDCRNNASTSVWLTSANVPYWKVYLNSGTAFSTVAENWTIPTMETSGQNLTQVSGDAYSLVDINGDGKSDLVDCRNNASTSVWLTSANVPYWKVYLNSGTAFSTVAENWTIPSMETSGQNLTQVSGAGYSLVDINGDGKSDLVDCRNNASTSVWLTSANVPYWKVYLNSGTSFSTVAENWTIPSMETSGQSLTQVSGAGYSMVDISGDGKPDLVDCRNNASTSVWLTSANVPYWKVYLNSTTLLTIEEHEILQALNIYPNPSKGLIHVNLSDMGNDNRIMITNSVGAVVYNEDVKDAPDFIFDLTSYEAGLYFISVQNNTKSYTAKVIRE